MTTTPDDAQQRAEALRADIERTREELGETVAQLAYKADVKARISARAATVPRAPLGAVFGAILAALAYLWWRNH